MTTDAPKPRLLVIDDEAMVCELVVDVARSAGYDAQSASTPADIGAMTAQSFDLAVVDLHLGGVDALDVLSRLAALGSCHRVLLITGSGGTVVFPG